MADLSDISKEKWAFGTALLGLAAGLFHRTRRAHKADDLTELKAQIEAMEDTLNTMKEKVSKIDARLSSVKRTQDKQDVRMDELESAGREIRETLESFDAHWNALRRAIAKLAPTSSTGVQSV